MYSHVHYFLIRTEYSYNLLYIPLKGDDILQLCVPDIITGVRGCTI